MSGFHAKKTNGYVVRLCSPKISMLGVLGSPRTLCQMSLVIVRNHVGALAVHIPLPCNYAA